MEFFAFIETEVLTALTSWYKCSSDKLCRFRLTVSHGINSLTRHCWHSPMSLQYGVIWSRGGGVWPPWAVWNDLQTSHYAGIGAGLGIWIAGLRYHSDNSWALRSFCRGSWWPIPPSLIKESGFSILGLRKRLESALKCRLEKNSVTRWGGNVSKLH